MGATYDNIAEQLVECVFPCGDDLNNLDLQASFYQDVICPLMNWSKVYASLASNFSYLRTCRHARSSQHTRCHIIECYSYWKVFGDIALYAGTENLTKIPTDPEARSECTVIIHHQ